jgi:dihydrofolate reductase
MPDVAAGMNAARKLVFSRSLERASWHNCELVRGDVVEEVRALKQQPGSDLVILGSGSLVAPLLQARLVDHLQLVVVPVALGGGRTLFAGLREPLTLRRTDSRVFANGNVVLWYGPR